MNVNEAGQMALAEKAAALGVDRFVMDDGWFGQRKTDHAGLGDWYVNPEKFPHGLKPLIDKVHSLGMDFGLWVEPEMVNPDSDLYRKHPDWVLNFPGRPRTEQRNSTRAQPRPARRARLRLWVLSTSFLPKTTSRSSSGTTTATGASPAGISFRAGEQKEVYVEFTRNLYCILAELRPRHPNVEIESCSGGGGRVDLGILRYVDEVWPSDNTDPFDRLTPAGRIHLRLHAADHDGLGHRLAALAQSPLHVAHLSHAELDAGLAGHRREHRTSGTTARWPRPSG